MLIQTIKTSYLREGVYSLDIIFREGLGSGLLVIPHLEERSQDQDHINIRIRIRIRIN